MFRKPILQSRLLREKLQFTAAGPPAVFGIFFQFTGLSTVFGHLGPGQDKWAPGQMGPGQMGLGKD